MSNNLQVFNKTLANPKTQEYLQQVLAEKKSAFVNNITALVANDVKLQACEPISLMYAGIKATALDLPLDTNLGFAYVIPYNNRKAGKMEAQFQIGYKGFIQLAIRSGQFKTLNVTDVKEGELKEVNPLTGEISFEARPNRDELKTIGYVAYFRLINGFEKTLYMDAKEMEKHAKTYSQTYSSNKDYVRNASKWATDFDAMAKKTVIKLLLSRYAPLSVEMQSAITSDQAVMDDKGTHYVDHTAVEDAVAEEITENANQEEIDIPEDADDEEEQPSEEDAQEETEDHPNF